MFTVFYSSIATYVHIHAIIHGINKPHHGFIGYYMSPRQGQTKVLKAKVPYDCSIGLTGFYPSALFYQIFVKMCWNACKHVLCNLMCGMSRSTGQYSK